MITRHWSHPPPQGSWIADWNQDPRPFIWTKTAEEILESLARFCSRISGAGH
jgi:hypothetical protein